MICGNADLAADDVELATLHAKAKAAGVPRSNVAIVQGESAREKVVRIEGAAIADLTARLAPR